MRKRPPSGVRACGAETTCLRATLQGPERLVAFGFRCWLGGCRTGDIESWLRAWCAFADVVGPVSAQPLVMGLGSWVRAVQTTTTRDIEVEQADCAGFCRDECLAVAMVAACQHRTCPALKACAFALLGTSHLDVAIESAERFALRLEQADQILSPASICNAATYVAGAGSYVN